MLPWKVRRILPVDLIKGGIEDKEEADNLGGDEDGKEEAFIEGQGEGPLKHARTEVDMK